MTSGVADEAISTATPVIQPRMMGEFHCLGSECPDNCCQQNWTVSVDDATVARWEKSAPELKEVIVRDEAHGWVIKPDPCRTHCPKFEQGLCAIHRDYSADMLGDACYSYPRATRRIGNLHFMAGAMSCPEIVRLALYAENPFAMEQAEYARIVVNGTLTLADKSVTADGVMRVMKVFFDIAGLPASTPELALMRLHTLARTLDAEPPGQWPHSIAAHWARVAAQLPSALPDPNNPFLLLLMLGVLARASQREFSPRFMANIRTIEQVLGCALDLQAGAVNTQNDATRRYERVREEWRAVENAVFQPLLRRYLQAEIASFLTPYSGLGGLPSEKIAILAIKYAMVRLGLMCLHASKAGNISPEEIITVVQSVSRVLDHLKEDRTFKALLAETGWYEPERLAGVLAG